MLGTQLIKSLITISDKKYMKKPILFYSNKLNKFFEASDDIPDFKDFLQNEYGPIAHHCVRHYGVVGYIYNWDMLINAISKLTFVKVKQAVTWGSKEHDTFFAINRKRLKKWFKQNHNRFLIPKNINRNWLRKCGLRTEDFFNDGNTI